MYVQGTPSHESSNRRPPSTHAAPGPRRRAKMTPGATRPICVASPSPFSFCNWTRRQPSSFQIRRRRLLQGHCTMMHVLAAEHETSLQMPSDARHQHDTPSHARLPFAPPGCPIPPTACLSLKVTSTTSRSERSWRTSAAPCTTGSGRSPTTQRRCSPP